MVSGLRNCDSVFVHYIQAGKTHADAILMEAILYRDALESRWLSTLREIFSSSIQHSLNGLFSVFMILRHDVVVRNELQQNINKQNSILETVRTLLLEPNQALTLF